MMKGLGIVGFGWLTCGIGKLAYPHADLVSVLMCAIGSGLIGFVIGSIADSMREAK